MKKDFTEKTGISRRHFIGTSAMTFAGIATSPAFSFGAPAILKKVGKPDSNIAGVQIGVISYSYRSMERDAESTLKYCVDSGISAIELMGYTAEDFVGAPQMPDMQGFPKRSEMTPDEKKQMEEIRAAYASELAKWRSTISMDKFRELRKMYNNAGVSIYAWKPSALGSNNTDAEIDYACRVARELGATHVTVEIPKDSSDSQRLGNLASKQKIKVGYHGHLQQTFTAWDEALNQSKYNALNLDIGHYVAAGFDPIPLIKDKHDHIVSMHIKDRQSKENGQANRPWGEGDTPLVEVLRLMRDKKYKFPATIELEYQIPEGSDAVQEVGKCLEFCRKALES